MCARVSIPPCHSHICLLAEPDSTLSRPVSSSVARHRYKRSAVGPRIVRLSRLKSCTLVADRAVPQHAESRHLYGGSAASTHPDSLLRIFILVRICGLPENAARHQSTPRQPPIARGSRSQRNQNPPPCHYPTAARLRVRQHIVLPSRLRARPFNQRRVPWRSSVKTRATTEELYLGTAAPYIKKEILEIFQIWYPMELRVRLARSLSCLAATRHFCTRMKHSSPARRSPSPHTTLLSGCHSTPGGGKYGNNDNSDISTPFGGFTSRQLYNGRHAIAIAAYPGVHL